MNELWTIYAIKGEFWVINNVILCHLHIFAVEWPQNGHAKTNRDVLKKMTKGEITHKSKIKNKRKKN